MKLTIGKKVVLQNKNNDDAHNQQSTGKNSATTKQNRMKKVAKEAPWQWKKHI